MKILFFGTPNFAQVVLKGLLESRHKVVGVVCQPDKPSGRGNKLKSPEIVSFAKMHGVNVYQFEKLSNHIDDFKNIDCDIFVTASYGKILPKALLDLKMCINVHPSLLPKYRGATPIQSALLNGDNLTGVTIMKTEVGMDDGDIFLQQKLEILPEDDYTSLEEKLSSLGTQMLLKVLDEIENNTYKRTPQNHAQATFVKPIAKEDGLLDFDENVDALVNKVRAFCQSPVAFFYVGGDRIKVYKAKIATDVSCGEMKEILPNKKRFLISCKDGVFEILKCQSEGGKVLDASAFLNGFRFKARVVD